MNRPSILYRYFPLRIENDEIKIQDFLNLENLLVKNELYFYGLEFLNDPYDCVAPVDIASFPPEVVEEMFSDFIKTMPKDEQKSFIESEDLRRYIRDKCSEVFYKFMIERACMCSFAGCHDQILLWTHYASNHSGFCVGFSIGDPRLSRALPVKYQNKRPHIFIPKKDSANIIELYAKTFIPLFYAKSHHWSYEKEWRVIIHDESPGFKSLADSTITDLYLGVRLRQEKERILSLVPREKHINVWQAELDKDRYNLMFKEVESK